MDKDNEKCNTNTSSVTEILKTGYSYLDSNIRKQMGEMLDAIFGPPEGWVHWKNRYLYPVRNIPKKNFDVVAQAMTETLFWGLQQQVDVLNGKIELVDKRVRHLSTERGEKESIVKYLNEMINTYKNE